MQFAMQSCQDTWDEIREKTSARVRLSMMCCLWSLLTALYNVRKQTAFRRRPQADNRFPFVVQSSTTFTLLAAEIDAHKASYRLCRHAYYEVCQALLIFKAQRASNQVSDIVTWW